MKCYYENRRVCFCKAGPCCYVGKEITCPGFKVDVEVAHENRRCWIIAACIAVPLMAAVCALTFMGAYILFELAERFFV